MGAPSLLPLLSPLPPLSPLSVVTPLPPLSLLDTAMLPLLLSLPDTAMLPLPLLLLKHPSTTSPSTTTTTPLPAVQSKVTCSKFPCMFLFRKGSYFPIEVLWFSYADPFTSDLGGTQKNSLFVLDMHNLPQLVKIVYK